VTANIEWLSPEKARVLYDELHVVAPRFLVDGGWSTATGFEWWSRQEPVFVVRWDFGLALVTHWYQGLSAEVHGIVTDWRAARVQLRRVFRELLTDLDVQRLEFRLKWPAKTLKRYLEAAGAVHEGTARGADWSYLSGKPVLIDVDIWSILCHDLEVEHGCKPIL